jgi:predicted dehydrogenase
MACGGNPSPSRRHFIKGGSMMLAGGAMVGNLSVSRSAHAGGSDRIRIGLVGCGSRGTAAAIEAMRTPGGGVELVAMADAFANNLHTAFRTIKGAHREKVSVRDAQFVGLDAYQQVIQSDADVIILATPPGFRPLHFEAAVQAGKHVFMEKPVATDAPGIRRVLAAGEIAKAKGLAVQVGLQRRHERRYRECIERLQAGAIGDLIIARAYWNAGVVRGSRRTAAQTELEFQLRNWYHFNWLSGDHIDEQHIHNLDVINWLKQSHPVEAQGQGGREVRGERPPGQIFDHHVVEYTYADGFRLLGQCRNIKGCWNNVSEHVHGSAGTCDISNGVIRDRNSDVRWKSETKEIKGKGWQQQQNDLFASLRRGEVPNETQYGAESTMTAILGRMATYSGRVVKWDDALHSPIKLADVDSLHSLDDRPPLRPDPEGTYPSPRPGGNRPVA